MSVITKNNWRFLLQTTTDSSSSSDGPFAWKTDLQGYILSSFFYGYVITQIPFGLLSKKYGSIYFLGVGMLINSLFGLLVPLAANCGIWWLIAVRFIQGLGEVSRNIELVQSEKPLKPVWGGKCFVSFLTSVHSIGFQL